MSPSLTVLVGSLDDGDRTTLGLLTTARLLEPEATIEVIAFNDGWSRPEFEAVAPLYVVHEFQLRRPSRALQMARLRGPASKVRSFELRKRMEQVGSRVLLADIGAARMLPWLPESCEVVSWIADAAALDSASASDRELLIARTSRWVVRQVESRDAVGRAVGVEPEAIATVPDFIPIEELWPDVTETTRGGRQAFTRSRLHGNFGVLPRTPLILGVGPVDQTPFAALCWDLHAGNPDVGFQFVWLSEGSTPRQLQPLRDQIAQSGLDHWFTIIESERVPVQELVQAADLQVCASSTPVPPACLALAARVGTLTVRYAEDGVPTPPLVVDSPAGDLPALADTIRGLLDSPGARRGAGQPAAEAPTAWDPRVGTRIILAQFQGPA